MNTLKYKPEYREQAAELLKNAPNMVQLPSGVFFDLAKLFTGENFDGAKFDKLLARTYTVLAVEEGKTVGIASVDKDGMIGVFAAKEGETSAKTCKQLLKALDRRAEKKELPFLFVLQTEKSEATFREFGYAPFENGDDVNEFMLAKSFQKKPKFSLESVKVIRLDPKKAIAVEGKTAVLPWFLLELATFFVALYVTLLLARDSLDEVYGSPSSWTTIGIVCGVLFVGALAFFIAYRVRAVLLKKEVLTMRVTNGIVLSHTADCYWDLSDEHQYTKSYRERVPKKTRHNVTYEYFDERMQKHEARYTHRYAGRGSYFYEGQELVIAYSGEKSYILRKYTILNTSSADATSAEETRPAQNAPEERVSAETLSKYVPLNAVKTYYLYALRFLVFFAVIVGVALFFSYFVARSLQISFGGGVLYLLPLLIFGAVFVGLPSLLLFASCLHYGRKFKKMIETPKSVILSGEFVHGDGAFQAKSELKFYFEYRDGAETKRIRVRRKFVAVLIKSGKSKAKVIVNGNSALVLVERGKYPDVASFFFPHY